MIKKFLTNGNSIIFKKINLKNIKSKSKIAFSKGIKSTIKFYNENKN